MVIKNMILSPSKLLWCQKSLGTIDHEENNSVHGLQNS
jgi:hypothetical protein